MSNNRYLLYVSLLYFKILLATPAYNRYCQAKIANDEFAEKALLDQHPNLEKIWLFWGDIYNFEKNPNEVKYFTKWFDQNQHKFWDVTFSRVRLVREGSLIRAKRGDIYCTIPKGIDAHMISHLFRRTASQIKSAANKMGGDYVLSLNKDNKSYTPLKTRQYERAVTVLYWRNYLGLSPKEIILKAYKWKSVEWDKFRIQVDKYHKISNKKHLKDLDLDDLQTIVRDIDRLRIKGEDISKSILDDDFTFPALARPF
tara:strand:- start:1255 stop:2022 length:768 start_codon:yes stop_codon:yes gene_type:complete